MISVMVMTPLHMHHGGATLEVIGVVISVHVLGMFAFAPLVGLGHRPVRPPAGARRPARSCCSSSLLLAGTSPAGASYRIGAGLFLLGLGWSLCTVAASTLLSESAPLDARTDVQGAADLVMGLTAAAAGALAGVVVGTFGYAALTSSPRCWSPASRPPPSSPAGPPARSRPTRSRSRSDADVRSRGPPGPPA